MGMALILAGGALCAGAAESGGGRLDWMVTAHGDGRHNAFTDLVFWKGQYYLCFRHGETHNSMDGEVRVMRSADLRSWEPCGTLKTLGDDRDPHFAVAGDTLYVFFGVWDLLHREGPNPPDRNKVRSHFASTTDGETWSKIQGVYEPGWWLWRVKYHDGFFYSTAYTALRPRPDMRETRLLRSADAVNWEFVSTVTTLRMAGESDMWFEDDGSMWIVTRTGDAPGHGWIHRSEPGWTEWSEHDLGTLIHSPVLAKWRERYFVAGRGRADDGHVTRLWELVDGRAVERLTLPSGGDTSYPGLLVDPASLAEGETPAFFISWYSQHERDAETDRNAASVYVGRVVLDK